mmetsp:Transcript_87309/g.282131  ORF Transcript_87309/g.282131 Transcript_87309/m.282131 type:complete len:295 (-) Transcript_87309:282-1166(-)
MQSEPRRFRRHRWWPRQRRLSSPLCPWQPKDERTMSRPPLRTAGSSRLRRPWPSPLRRQRTGRVPVMKLAPRNPRRHHQCLPRLRRHLGPLRQRRWTNETTLLLLLLLLRLRRLGQSPLRRQWTRRVPIMKLAPRRPVRHRGLPRLRRPLSPLRPLCWTNERMLLRKSSLQHRSSGKRPSTSLRLSPSPAARRGPTSESRVAKPRRLGRPLRSLQGMLPQPSAARLWIKRRPPLSSEARKAKFRRPSTLRCLGSQRQPQPSPRTSSARPMRRSLRMEVANLSKAPRRFTTLRTM